MRSRKGCGLLDNKRRRIEYPLKGKVIKEPFNESDIVACVGCRYWQKFDNYIMCCHYCYETGRPRGILPKECYRHEGTPYSPKKPQREKSRPLFINKKMRGEK